MTDRITLYDTVEPILSARQVASYAISLGVMSASRCSQPCATHLGAIMADAVLQSGISYRSVVYPRVKRIITKFPKANTLREVCKIIESGDLSNFLLWTHSEKLNRFCSLALYFEDNKVETVEVLSDKVRHTSFRSGLLSIRGIGPKTVDYISCISGVDAVAVDRHMATFAHEAGVYLHEYDDLRTVFSYAADLLDMPRRNLDSWIWNTISSRKSI